MTELDWHWSIHRFDIAEVNSALLRKSLLEASIHTWGCRLVGVGGVDFVSLYVP